MRFADSAHEFAQRRRPCKHLPRCAGVHDYADRIWMFFRGARAGCEIYYALGDLLSEAGESTTVGDEGGFAPLLRSTEEALSFLVRAVERADYRLGEEVVLALDCAASEFYRDDRYHIEGKALSAEEWISKLGGICARFPIASVEDPLAEDDWKAWTSLTAKLGDRLQIVGDDLFATNVQRLEQGLQQKAGNALLLKPNQVGTLSEALHCAQEARRGGFGIVVSHRSGETEDPFLADLAVALRISGQIKAGAPVRGERTAKYNQLLRIEGELGEQALYAGVKSGFAQLQRVSPDGSSCADGSSEDGSSGA